MDGPIDVVLPKFGMGMREGAIIAWHVRVGDTVMKGQVIVDVEVKKADVELEAPASGRIIEILVNDGESVVVQQLLARIEMD